MSLCSMHEKKTWHCGAFWVFWIFPLLYTSVFALASVAQLYIFNVNDWDFSYFSVLFWNILEGNGWVVPFNDAQTGLPFYTHHWVPGAIFFAPFLYFFPSPYTLSIVHALAIGSVFFILPRLVRCIFAEHGHENWMATAIFIQIFTFFYIPFLAAWKYQTHLTTLVAPMVLLAVWALHKKKTLWACVCCLFLALGQERSSVAVFGVGMYAIFLLRQHKLGLALCLFSSIYFAAAIKLMEWLRHGVEYHFANTVAPLRFIKEKIFFIGTFFVYTACMPLLGRRAFLTALCALPVIAIGLISSRDGMFNFIHHYQDLPAMFALISVIYAILFLKEHAVKWQKYVYPCALILVAYFSLVGAPKSPHPFTILFLDVPGKNLPEIVKLHEDVQHVLHITKKVALRTQSGLGPWFSLREKRYALSEADLEKNFSQEVIVISPLASTYLLSTYENTLKKLHENTSLKHIADTGRLQVFVAKDVPLIWKE